MFSFSLEQHVQGKGIATHISTIPEGLWFAAVEAHVNQKVIQEFLSWGVNKTLPLNKNRPQELYSNLVKGVEEFKASCSYISFELIKESISLCHIGDFRCYLRSQGLLNFILEDTVGNASQKDLEDYPFEFQDYQKRILLKTICSPGLSPNIASWNIKDESQFYVLSGAYHQYEDVSLVSERMKNISIHSLNERDFNAAFFVFSFSNKSI